MKKEVVYRITVYDNNLESEISLDDLSLAAENYYIKQLISLTKQKLQQKQLITA
jgi:hypothetical protein